MKDWAAYFAGAIIYTGFFGLIALSVWWTQSAWCLWALVLAPTIKQSK